MPTYYVQIGGNTFGPFDGEKLKKLAAAGKISSGDLVSKDGKSRWTVAAKVKGLFPAPADAPAPAPLRTG